MQTVRRIYVYFMSAVSLVALGVGVANLLRLAFDQAGIALGISANLAGPDGVRQEVSLYVAVAIVALPIWLVHWWLAERAVLRPGADGEAERGSWPRALYLSVALGASLTLAVTAAAELIYRGVVQAAGYPLFGAATVSSWLAMLIVAGAAWGYHGRVRLRDTRAGELAGSAAWLPRLYLYGAAGAGAMLLLFGAGDLLRLGVDALLGPGALIAPTPWWAEPLATGASRVVVGLAVWAAHWGYAQRLLEAPDWRARSEQSARIRRLYLYAGAVVGLALTLRGGADTLAALLRAALGVSSTVGAAGVARSALVPLLTAVPFALFGLYQLWSAADEARRYGTDAVRATVRRLSTYVVALVGLAFAGVGLAYTLGVLIDLAFGGSRTLSSGPDWWRGQVSQFGSVALVGAVAWLWGWYAAQRALAAEPEAEQSSTTRRAYLYTVLAASLVAILSSLAFVLYRVLTVVLNAAPSTGLTSDVSASLGVVLVAGALAIYHGLALRRDLAVRPAFAGEGAAEPNELTLVMTGPPDADLDAELADLLRHLPAGFSLRRRALP
ncbi:MAG TPA: DUF5671 domain-containing protein [Thermomicrobiaceae bacterium]|nr:DUF5671 domain-containing protein [Thermomicrobiaceae bacterium]